MSTWADLRALRAAGVRPSLPIIIATHSTGQSRAMADSGCLVILHQPGETFHVELLEGLRVWMLVNCDRASAVIRAMNAKAVRPIELATWCQCFDRMDFQPVSCEVAAQWH